MWNKEEIELLIANADASLEVLKELLPSKSINAIRNKRSRLKRSPKRLKPWTEEERTFLADNYNTTAIEDLVNHFDRSASAIRSQVHYLKARQWRFKND